MLDHRSPYRTAPGSEPPELAGREGELGAAVYALEMTAEHEPPSPIVFHGLRGMGKTALLRDVARRAVMLGAVALVFEADRDLRLATVMRAELESALRSNASFPTRLRTALEALVERMPKLTYELPSDSGSVSVAGSGLESDGDHESIEGELFALSERLHESGRFLMIGLDELQEASRIDLLRIVRVVHRSAGTRSPICFVGAGLPSSPNVLHEARTYTERWTKYGLTYLGHDATLEAVQRPAERLGVTWTRDALERLYELAAGYPYFIQQYASATWLRAKSATIERSDVAAIEPGVRSALDAGLYEPSFSRMTPRETALALALYGLGPGRHRLDEVAAAMGFSSSAAIGSTRASLDRKDVTFSAMRGFIEFRVPLADQYIERHAAELRARAVL